MSVGLLANHHCVMRLQGSLVEYSLNGDVTYWADSRVSHNTEEHREAHDGVHAHNNPGHFTPMYNMDGAEESDGGLKEARE